MSRKTPIGVRVPRGRRTRAIISTAAALAATAGLAGPASAAITPTLPADGLSGFPFAYTDDRGISVTHCQDESGFCIEAPRPQPDQPVAVPGNFTEDGESFYWLGEANIPNAGTGFVRFAVEAAFANEDIAAGDQIVFQRERYRFQGLKRNGWYRVTHPWGTTDVQADNLGIVNRTSDVGCAGPPCDFSVEGGPMTSMLTWDTPVPNANEAYVGNPLVAHTVTGSPLGTNFVQLNEIAEEGAVAVGALVGRTDEFFIQGKVADPAAAPGPAANLGLSTASLNFPDRQAGTASTTQTVTVTNHGNAVMNIGGVTLTGIDAADFTLASTCAATLDPGATCTISVTFAPKKTGDLSASVQINDDAFGGPHSISLTGTGTPAGTPAPPTGGGGGAPPGGGAGGGAVPPQVIPGPTQIIIQRPAVAVQGTTVAGAAPRLGLQDLLPVGRITRAKLRAQGLRLRMQLEDGTRVVRIAIFRAKRNGQRTGRPLFTTVRRVKATTTRITLRKRAVKRLKAGRYVARIQPGRNRADRSGVSSSVAFRVR